jgi:hypothetical protein
MQGLEQARPVAGPEAPGRSKTWNCGRKFQGFTTRSPKPFDELVFSYLAAPLRPVNGERLNLRFIRSRAISIC